MLIAILSYIIVIILTIYAMAFSIKFRKKKDKVYFSQICDEFEILVFFAFIPFVNLVIFMITVVSMIIYKIKDVRLL